MSRKISPLMLAAIVPILMLVGCAPGDEVTPVGDTVAATSTDDGNAPIVDEAKQLEAGLVDDAVLVLERSMQVFAEVGADGGTRPERLEAVASGPYLTSLLDAVASWRNVGVHIEGQQRFILHGGEVADDGQRVILDGCRDTTGWKFVGDDGYVKQGDSMISETYTVQVVDGEWLVTGRYSNAGFCPSASPSS